MKIRPLGVELFHADGRTEADMTKVIVVFRKFANEHKNRQLRLDLCYFVCK